MVESSELKSPISRRFLWLAPALVGIYPALNVYMESIRDATLGEVLICSIALATAAIALAYLFRMIFPDGTRASLAAVVFVVWAFSYSGYVRLGRLLLQRLTLSPLRDYFLMLAWLLLLPTTLYLLYRLQWSRGRVKRVYQLVVLACFFSIAVAAVKGAMGKLEVDQSVDVPASIWNSKLEAMAAAWKPQPMKEHRDLYYLLFDRYGSEESLRRFFNFDDGEFYRELEKRGFIVDRRATTSYPSTAPSMSSTLNMRYLKAQLAPLSDYYDTVHANEVGRLLIRAGYQYHYFGNAYDPLRKSSIAQWNMKVSSMPSAFADSLVSMTPFRPLMIGREHKREFTLEKFAVVAELAKDPNLTFAYAHFLVPHPPYAFARDGSAQSEINRAIRTEQELYIDQLVATNRLILKLIDELLSASDTRPIIVLQAAQGPYLMSGDESLSRDEQIAKRLGILNAILIPDDDIRQRIAKPPKPVNTFRFLFKEYFRAPIQLLPERAFYWEKPLATGAAADDTQIIEVTHDVSRDK